MRKEWVKCTKCEKTMGVYFKQNLVTWHQFINQSGETRTSLGFINKNPNKIYETEVFETPYIRKWRATVPQREKTNELSPGMAEAYFLIEFPAAVKGREVQAEPPWVERDLNTHRGWVSWSSQDSLEEVRATHRENSGELQRVSSFLSHVFG